MISSGGVSGADLTVPYLIMAAVNVSHSISISNSRSLFDHSFCPTVNVTLLA